MAELYSMLRRAHTGPEALVLTKRPLALSDRLADRIRRVDGPILLVSPDLEDPLPAWSKTRLGRKTVERTIWRSLSSFGAESDEIQGAASALRTVLPREMVQASPRLGPALSTLLEALGEHRSNPQSWVFRTDGALDAKLEGLNTGTNEAFRLKVSPDGLERWPALDPGNLPIEAQFSKHAQILLIPAEEVAAFVAHLKG